MPSKLGFGNTRKAATKKVSYGSALHYKNPIMKKTDKDKVKLSKDEKTGFFINDLIKLRKKKKSVKFMGGIENYNKAKAVQTKYMQGLKGGKSTSTSRVINPDIY